MINKNLQKELGLEKFAKDLNNIESQYLNLIYNPLFDNVVERWVYEKTIGLMEWKCAICGDSILTDRNRIDVENFVCDKCKELYNNKNPLVDRRILSSRNKMFEFLENRLYEELEDSLKRESK